VLGQHAPSKLSRSRGALSAYGHNESARKPLRVWHKTPEPREMISRSSLLTGRSPHFATVHLARQVGLEPTTSRLTAGCSTIELLPNFARSPGRQSACPDGAFDSIGRTPHVKLGRPAGSKVRRNCGGAVMRRPGVGRGAGHVLYFPRAMGGRRAGRDEATGFEAT
jgi:hypothetical protein